MSGRLEGKSAIITGAGSGIGRATAMRFAEEGASVLCADLNEGGAKETAAAAVDAGGEAMALRVDVSSLDDVNRMAAKAQEAFGAIDVLLANAGIPGVGDAVSTDLETWNRVISVNLTGVWLSSKAVLPQMLEQKKGAIIHQASIGGLVGVLGITPYAAAKGGVIALTRQMAVEFGGRGIRVNAICPGTLPTPLVTDTYEVRGRLGLGPGKEGVEEGLRQAALNYPMGRLGTVDEVANLALFLASDEASWITGGIYTIDGGYTAA